jgi:hypothetical protein
MRNLVLNGQRGAALARYQACRRTLREELDVEPGAETERLYEQLGPLAHHWDRADEPRKAMPYLLRASEQARTAYADEEAVAHLDRAPALLDSIPARGGGELCREQGGLLAFASAQEGLGQAHHGTGKAREAETRFREAIALDREMGLTARQQVRLYAWLADALPHTFAGGSR